MPRRHKRIVIFGLALLLFVAAVPALIWMSLTHQPRFYRAMVTIPRAQRQEGAKRFVAQSLQLRNDIINEPRWEAVFTDEEVNAWLAEDLVTHFADQLPPEVHEPRVVFEPGRITLAFQLDQGPVRSVIWVVARARVPEPNVVELTVEKIRAGVMPVPADQIIEKITHHARGRGLDIRWSRDGDLPVALMSYTPDISRNDVVLEQMVISQGRIRLAGRSNRERGPLVSPVLPRKKILQSAFPRRHIQVPEDSESARAGIHNSSTPAS